MTSNTVAVVMTRRAPCADQRRRARPTVRPLSAQGTRSRSRKRNFTGRIEQPVIRMPAPAQPNTEGCDGLPCVRLLRAVEEKPMFTKRHLATTIVVAAFMAACDDAPSLGGRSPTAPSANSSLASAEQLTQAEAAALSSACGFGSGDDGKVIHGTPPPPGAPPPDTVVGPPNNTPGPPPTGAELAIAGDIESLTGSCPAITFAIGRNTVVRATATTSFGSGSCASLKSRARVGAMGTAQADGSILASCVASSF